MNLHDHSSSFLFNSFDWKAPSTARKVHIRRLLDILHLSIQRRDLPRARKAFGLLSRCEEIEWAAIWKLSLLLLADQLPTPGGAPRTAKQIDFLRVMMLQHPEEREALVQELVLSLVIAGRERDALDELELYLPSLPYQENSVLHTYAGLLCLRLADADLGRDAQEQKNDNAKPTLLREARQHLERAQALDPEGVVAQAFIRKIATLAPQYDMVRNDSDDDMVDVDSKGQRRKRIRN
ncbi:hypothetical protein EDB92DRAFT_936187 [Lactarius akahatsu]|uniref:Uncharacterized protein n=1 Tax=Lactarius akahatsu TaxID=416441 RepID=A0AAD4LQQ1_9AGAM|nr:hypothetical protein EDB92DRAFT_936187 [Lactarius akahatsu]